MQCADRRRQQKNEARPNPLIIGTVDPKTGLKTSPSLKDFVPHSPHDRNLAQLFTQLPLSSPTFVSGQETEFSALFVKQEAASPREQIPNAVHMEIFQQAEKLSQSVSDIGGSMELDINIDEFFVSNSPRLFLLGSAGVLGKS